MTGPKMPGDRLGLPLRPFLYTLDQIAGLLDLRQDLLEKSFIFFERRSTGANRAGLMTARNIAEPHDKPEWRVNEEELIRWMRLKGYRIYQPTYLKPEQKLR